MIDVRGFHIDDYEAAVALWKNVEGIEIAEGDERNDIAFFLERNPGLSRVAFDGERMIAAVLCGHDGHRGYIYHLAVDLNVRRTGLAARLVDECLAGLRQAGLKRALILVAGDNPGGRSFWERRGWEVVEDAAAMGIDL